MDKSAEPEKVNFNIDPSRVPVLSVDSYLIGSNEHMVTLNFSQGTLDPRQQQVVSRVALTHNQAREFVAKLNEHIDKFEV